jgi:hypothetical protein
MSLKFFHILFIAVSTLMSIFVGLWALDAYRQDGTATWLALAVLAFGGGAGLVVYGNRFLHKMRKFGIVALLVAGTLGAPGDVLACTICLGNTDSLLRSGMNMGILALLGFVGFMLVSFASFFIYLARRARQPQDVGAGVGAGFSRPASTNVTSPEGSL